MEDNTFANMFEICYETLVDMFIKRKYITEVQLNQIKENFYNFGIDNKIETYDLTKSYFIKKIQTVTKSTRQNKSKNNSSLTLNSSEGQNTIGKNIILLYCDKSTAKKDNESTENVIEIYMGDWLYNPLLNERQSEYEKLDTEQKQLLLEFYDIKETNLPKIDINEKISKFYDCKNGDILKITRYTSKNGIQYYYRIVRAIV